MILCTLLYIEITRAEHETQITQREHATRCLLLGPKAPSLKLQTVCFFYCFFRFRSTSCMVHAYVDSRGAQRFVGFYSLECAFRTLIGWADKHRSRGSTAVSIWITSQSRTQSLLASYCACPTKTKGSGKDRFSGDPDWSSI